MNHKYFDGVGALTQCSAQEICFAEFPDGITKGFVVGGYPIMLTVVVALPACKLAVPEKIERA